MAETLLRDMPEFKALEAHFLKIEKTHLRDLFAADPKRGEAFARSAEGLYLDFSKNRVTAETIEAPDPAGGGFRTEGEDRCNVLRREDQCYGEPCSAARRAAVDAG